MRIDIRKQNPRRIQAKGTIAIAGDDIFTVARDNFLADGHALLGAVAVLGFATAQRFARENAMKRVLCTSIRASLGVGLAPIRPAPAAHSYLLAVRLVLEARLRPVI